MEKQYKVYFINLKYKAKEGKVNALSASCLSLLHRFSLLFVLRPMLLSAPGFALRLASRFSFRFALRPALRFARRFAPRFALRFAFRCRPCLAPRASRLIVQ